MIKDVVTVSPDDSLLTAADILEKKGFDGLPVINSEGILVGLITQSNLVSSDTNIHLPTLLIFLKIFDLYRKDKKFVEKQMNSILSLKVSDVMNTEPPLLYESESVDRAIMYLSSTHGVNPTSVVTQERKLLGVVTRRDIFKLYENNNAALTSVSATSPVVEERIKIFLDSFQKHYLFISRWRTRAWLTANVFFLVVGVFLAAFFMLRIQFK